MADVGTHDFVQLIREHTLRDLTSFDRIGFGPEIRRAELYTEIVLGGETLAFRAAGARSCSPTALQQDDARGTLVYNLECDLTYFHADESPVGPITVIDDPRRAIYGKIILRRGEDGRFQLPALSFFNQYLIFHVGDQFFYYPSEWQVVASITAWPPEYHQYHHLVDETPVFDFNTRRPDVARKGISTISILDELSDKENHAIREAHAREVELVSEQPGFRVAPEDFLTTPYE